VRFTSHKLGDIGIEIVALSTISSARERRPNAGAIPSPAAWNESDADLWLTEQGALPAGEAHIAGQHQLVTDAARAAANFRDAHDWRGREAQYKIAPKAQRFWPFGRLATSRWATKKSGFADWNTMAFTDASATSSVISVPNSTIVWEETY